MEEGRKEGGKAARRREGVMGRELESIRVQTRRSRGINRNRSAVEGILGKVRGQKATPAAACCSRAPGKGEASWETQR